MDQQRARGRWTDGPPVVDRRAAPSGFDPELLGGGLADVVREAIDRRIDQAALVTRPQLAEALAALREEVRREVLAAVEVERRGPCPPASATKPEEGTTLAATARRLSTVLRSPRQRPGPPRVGAGSGGQEPTAGRAAEASLGGEDGEEVEPAGLHEQRLSRRSSTSVADTVDHKFTFHESLWNAVIFIGTAEIGQLGSIFTLAELLFNAAMQILMCLIINDNLTQVPVSEDDIEQYKYWRTTVAHNINFVDQFSWESLAKRVCHFNYAPMSASPIRGLDDIQGYMPDRASKEFLDGPPLGEWGAWMNSSRMPVGATMCCLALVIWWMTVLHEVYNIFDMTMAIWLLPQGRTVFTPTDEGYKLEAVSNPRRCLIGAVTLLRAGICVLLGVFGTLYLTATISLGDLILNAVALEIVLNLDELAFSVCAPASARTLIQSIRPLPAGRSAAFRGLDWKPVFALLFCTVALVCVDASLLRPQIERLTRARDAICGGNRDFIFGVDMAGLVWASKPESEVEVTNTYPFRAVRRAIEDAEAVEETYRADGWLTANWGTVSGEYWSVENIANLPTKDASGLWNIYCRDIDEAGSRWASDYWRVALQILRDAPGIPTDIASCKDVAGFCDEQEERGVRARQFCPQTCGCDDPASNLTFTSASLGCPKVCRFSDMYHDKLSELNCTDYSPKEPQMINGTSVMDVFMTSGMEHMMFHYGADIGYFMEQGGCPLVLTVLRGTWVGDLCVEENFEGLRPMTLVCPETCRCEQTNALLCPTSCSGDKLWVDVGSWAEDTAGEAKCTPFDNDACLQGSATWGPEYTCASATEYCVEWAKDMQRCCSLSCGTDYLTEWACQWRLDGAKGSCVYPHDGSDCAA